MNRIYKVVWNAARGCYVVGSELISCHSREKSGRLAKIKINVKRTKESRKMYEDFNLFFLVL